MNKFKILQNMNNGRIFHACILLQNKNSILITGGEENYMIHSDVEIFSNETKQFKKINTMNSPRILHTINDLHNNMILLTGGGSIFSSDDTIECLKSAELYDIEMEKFINISDMNYSRIFHTATFIPPSNILIVGGSNNNMYHNTAELYNIDTKSFSITGYMNQCRDSHTATLLDNIEVLITGGKEGGDIILDSVEIYNFTMKEFYKVNNMIDKRVYHTATNLLNGYILITGGMGCNEKVLNSAELYCIETKEFIKTGDMIYERFLHTATNMMNGYILIIGGGERELSSVDSTCDIKALKSCEMYCIETKKFYRVDDMLDSRILPSVVRLNDMEILVTGGCNVIDSDGCEIGINTAELYTNITYT